MRLTCILVILVMALTPFQLVSCMMEGQVFITAGNNYMSKPTLVLPKEIIANTTEDSMMRCIMGCERLRMAFQNRRCYFLTKQPNQKRLKSKQKKTAITLDVHQQSCSCNDDYGPWVPCQCRQRSDGKLMQWSAWGKCKALPPAEDFLDKVAATGYVPAEKLYAEYVRCERANQKTSGIQHRFRNCTQPTNGSRPCESFYTADGPREDAESQSCTPGKKGGKKKKIGCPERDRNIGACDADRENLNHYIEDAKDLKECYTKCINFEGKRVTKYQNYCAWFGYNSKETTKNCWMYTYCDGFTFKKGNDDFVYHTPPCCHF